MLSKIRKFFSDYKQFAFVAVMFTIGIGLDLGGLDTAAHWVLGVTATVNLLPLLWGMVQDLRDGKWGIDVLAATAILTSVLLGEYYAGMIIVLMLTGGEALEDYAENRAKVELESLMKNAPEKACVLRGRKEVMVPVSKLAVGDKILVRPGEIIPVDGIIIDGQTAIDESSLTGESIPIDKKKGDAILSGAVTIDGVLTIRATETAEHSQYQQIIKLVKNAASTESPFVRLTDRYAVPFTIFSFSIAGAVWAASGDPVRFLQVIVVATPCPLLLAAPIALISGMSRSAKHGIIVKSGSSLEKLAQTRTFAFDKTGTLTIGKPVLSEIKSMAGFKQSDVLAAAAALEKNSTHVLAEAIVDRAARDNLSMSGAKNLREYPGRGLSATIRNKQVLVGKLDYLLEHDIALPARFNAESITTTSTYVAIGGTLAGVISFKDEIRPDSKHMLSALSKLGIKDTLMVTGDNKRTADKVGKMLGIRTVVSEALPGDKIRAIENLNNRPVAFVGDGVNDAPVLTAADVGIALGARGSTAATESADVVILTDDISQVSNSLTIAKNTFKIAKQAILIGIGMSIGLQLIFASGRFAPSLGAALQEVIDVAVILIALRAHGSFRIRKQSKPSLLKQA